jgi:hypothetical protein
VANYDISTVSANSRGRRNAARSWRQAVAIVAESACGSEITAGCNLNVSSRCSALGVDTGYFDVVAGFEGDFATFFFFGVAVYEPCLNAAGGCCYANVSGVAGFVCGACVDVACLYFSCTAGDADVAACCGGGTGIESSGANVAASLQPDRSAY